MGSGHVPSSLCAFQLPLLIAYLLAFLTSLSCFPCPVYLCYSLYSQHLYCRRRSGVVQFSSQCDRFLPVVYPSHLYPWRFIRVLHRYPVRCSSSHCLTSPLYQGRDLVHGSLDLALAHGTFSLLRALALFPSGHAVYYLLLISLAFYPRCRFLPYLFLFVRRAFFAAAFLFAFV